MPVTPRTEVGLPDYLERHCHLRHLDHWVGPLGTVRADSESRIERVVVRPF